MQRKQFIQKIEQAFRVHPIVALLGPRQCGKTTIAKKYIKKDSILLSKKKGSHVFPRQNYFDLENILDLARLEHPLLALSELKNLIVIDEIQRIPALFPTLRVLVDEKKAQRFLILGSASQQLIHQSSESLAGRIQLLELTPFSYQETENLSRLWLRGGFPLSYLASNEIESSEWRKAYIKTFLEQDIPNLGIRIPANNLRRFWMMLSDYHGSVFNASELARALDLSQKTIKHYLDILVGTFMLRELKPWHENINKRQVKSPKIYFRDSGLLHTLLGIQNKEDLLTNRKLGSSWEGMAIEEIIRFEGIESEDCYFWATHAEAELDLLIIKNGKRLGFEFKYTDSPKRTRSMCIAQRDLKLDSLTLISPGQHDFPLPDGMRASGLEVYLNNSKA